MYNSSSRGKHISWVSLECSHQVTVLIVSTMAITSRLYSTKIRRLLLNSRYSSSLQEWMQGRRAHRSGHSWGTILKTNGGGVNDEHIIVNHACRHLKYSSFGISLIVFRFPFDSRKRINSPNFSHMSRAALQCKDASSSVATACLIWPVPTLTCNWPNNDALVFFVKEFPKYVVLSSISEYYMTSVR